MACQEREPNWYQDPDQLKEEYDHHGTFLAVAVAHGGAATTYQKWWQRHGFKTRGPGPKPRTSTSDELTLDAARIADVHTLLRERGLDPEEWVIVRVLVNAWEGFYTVDQGAEKVTNKQLKVTLRPRLDVLLRPAVTHETAPKPKVRAAKVKPSFTKPRLVVFVGDEQAPYHDETLHRLFCQWLAANKPDEAVHLGDLMDLPTLSRHRTNPEWNASPQECVQAGYDILAAYRVSSPDTRWAALPGNHDERIRDYQLQRAPELFGIRAADLDAREQASLHALPSLLHLDALGFDWLGTDADYEHAQADVSPELVARHGFITGANSAARTVQRLGLSVVLGHTHRQVITYVTEERRRQRFTMLGVEAGCMCKVDGGLGYVVNPAWEQGFFAANVWPDGSFSGEHGTYRAGVLTWRDQRYADRAVRAA